MNEAAKAMLMQILKMDTTPRMENMGNSGGFLIKNFPDSSSSTRNSGVTLAEMPTASGTGPYMPVSSGFSAICSSSTPSEIQSSSTMADMVATVELPDVSMLPTVPEAVAPCQTNMNIPGFSPLQGIAPGGNPADVQKDSNFESLYMDPASVGLDGQDFSPDTEIDIFDGDQKLPDINDSFWEQFLSASPISGDIDEVDSAMQEATAQTEADNSWDSDQNMAQLSEQMELLSSQNKD
ncbi:hypothetical protein J5N97_024958 [Dioscorea zingiberensis]|uniref:Uncharacterized protein n=1 Tax=Dioscorea zingiberensis TaxID=325984 RepID=A0A9D5H932_9LILI|nr:hypothetical protein J5N97_024958 [Dioscorea zingiberensis]